MHPTRATERNINAPAVRVRKRSHKSVFRPDHRSMALALCVQRRTYCGWSGHGTAWQGGRCTFAEASSRERSMLLLSGPQRPTNCRFLWRWLRVRGTATNDDDENDYYFHEESFLATKVCSASIVYGGGCGWWGGRGRAVDSHFSWTRSNEFVLYSFVLFIWIRE